MVLKVFILGFKFSKRMVFKFNLLKSNCVKGCFSSIRVVLAFQFSHIVSVVVFRSFVYVYIALTIFLIHLYINVIFVIRFIRNT